MAHAPENIASTVLDELRGLLDEEEIDHEKLADDDVLVHIGIDSLAFAVLITRLEDVLGFDPFQAIERGAPPRTVKDLVEFYTAASAKS